MQKNYTILSLLILALLINSCENTDKPALGAEDEIVVVADSAEYAQLRTVLQGTFEQIIYTPQPEKLFTLKHISPEQIEAYQNSKNLIIAAPLNSKSNTSKFIGAIVDSASLQKSAAGSKGFVKKYNLWAKDQLVMFISASNMDELQKNITDNKDNLFDAFQNISDKRLYASLYNADHEQKHIEGKLLKDYGWVMYVQSGCDIALDKPEDNFIWLKRSPSKDMARWIFVHWIENASPQYLNEDSIRAVRNRMTQKYYRTEGKDAYSVIAKDYLMVSEANFKGRYAIMTQGLWEVNEKDISGPFVNYTFYDEDSKRIYMLDGSVYAPKYYKRNLIQQVDVTLHSFMTEKEVSQDKKQALLKAAEEHDLTKK